MFGAKTTYIETQYYIGPERRHAHMPRRSSDNDRRHRYRSESLISECRSNAYRRTEDNEGYFEIATLYEKDTDNTHTEPNNTNRKRKNK